MTDIKQTDKLYVANTYARFPVQMVSGKGSLMYDTEGKEYIDMGTGIGVNIFGIADEEWIAAVTKQLGALQHTSNLYYTSPCSTLAQRICEKTGMKKVFFANSGAEVNECAIKAARKYGAEKKGSEYSTIITLWNSFHGRTHTTLAATGQEHYHELFQPLTPGFVHATPNDIESVEALVKENKVCAIMMECIQGEGGVLTMEPEFIQAVAKICTREDILLVIDEVQTGNGRTGALYSYMNYGITPDIFTTAKGIGGGLPLGACVLGDKVKDIFAPGDNGSTFGGNPVACAGAVTIMDRLTTEVLQGVRERGEYIFSVLKDKPGIESVSGMGLMVGIKPVKPAGEIVKKCLERGVMCLTAKDKIRLLPALNIPMEQLKKAMDIIIEACAE